MEQFIQEKITKNLIKYGIKTIIDDFEKAFL